MTSRTRRLLSVFALLGLAASATSTYVHYRLLTDPTHTSFCDVSASISCTQAYLSKYGSFLGAPVAILGVLFFALILSLIAFAPAPPVIKPGKKVRVAEATGISGENVTAYVFVLSTIGLAFAAYLAWASFFQLRTLCILCAITYAAVVGLVLASYAATRFPIATVPQRAARDLSTLAKSPAALSLGLLLVAGGLLAIVSFPHESGAHTAEEASPQYPPLTDEQRVQFEKWYDIQPVADVPIDKGTAKVLIVKFNDYQCPPCRRTYNEYRGILAKYTASGDVKYVLKHFPLEYECNTKNVGHLAACEAAAAVIMAHKKGTAEKLEAWLFANQGPPLLTPDQVRKAAADVGGITDFDAQYPTVLSEVRADAMLGDKLGAKSTPTFFINGRRIDGALPPAAFDLGIQLELKRVTH